MAIARVTEFTDPACPWAYSAEPYRRRLEWVYGDQIEWDLRMVVLSETTERYEAMGYDVARQSRSSEWFAREYGMPIDSSERPRLAVSVDACRAIVAARLHAPGKEHLMIRWLRIRLFAGQLLDDPATIEGAARDSGIDPDEMRGWLSDPEVESAMRDDMRAARSPRSAALAQDGRLADANGDGESDRRYTCPSYDVIRSDDGLTISAPGFQPLRSYSVAFANVIPDAEQRATPEDVAEVLEWADFPLCTQEVAEICEIDAGEARERLAEVAEEQRIGSDGIWSLK